MCERQTGGQADGRTLLQIAELRSSSTAERDTNEEVEEIDNHSWNP